MIFKCLSLSASLNLTMVFETLLRQCLKEVNISASCIGRAVVQLFLSARPGEKCWKLDASLDLSSFQARGY